MVFLIYINGLHNSLESEPRLFLNDTYLLVKGLNSEQLEINLSAELHHLHLWSSLNKLSVNLAKTRDGNRIASKIASHPTFFSEKYRI